MPVIGYPEQYYVKLVEEADAAGDVRGHAAGKVGQYVTVGIDHNRSPQEKIRCFHHAYKHYCVAPAQSDAETLAFFDSLADVVRHYAGREALRLGHAENERLMAQHDAGTERWLVKREAIAYFTQFCNSQGLCPEWMSHDAWERLMEMRAAWT